MTVVYKRLMDDHYLRSRGPRDQQRDIDISRGHDGRVLGRTSDSCKSRNRDFVEHSATVYQLTVVFIYVVISRI